MNETLYDILEVAPHASAEVIRAAYKVLISYYHPDRRPNDKTAVDKCAALNKAYETLSDKDKRSQYDWTLKERKNSFTTTHQYHRPSEPQPKEQKYDPKWDLFLAERPNWAKKVIPPYNSCGNTDIPVRKLSGGFTDIRPDLQTWAQWLLSVGRQNNISYSDIKKEIIRTWNYFAKDHGSLAQSLVEEAVNTMIQRAQGYTETKVQFGV